MSGNTRSDVDVATGYETKDVSVRVVVWLAVAILAIGLVVHVMTWWLLRSMRAEARRHDPTLSPLIDQSQTTREPRLQSAPAHDYVQIAREQEQMLTSYGWVDRQKGIARIPIERAIDLLVERGEPDVPSPDQKRDSRK
jgi:hypothetical protein